MQYITKTNILYAIIAITLIMSGYSMYKLNEYKATFEQVGAIFTQAGVVTKDANGQVVVNRVLSLNEFQQLLNRVTQQ